MIVAPESMSLPFITGDVHHASLRANRPMIPIQLCPMRGEGDCPIKFAVRRPWTRTGSSPHATAAHTLEVTDLVFPDVIDDACQPAGQRHTGELLSLCRLEPAIPGAQRAGPTRGLRGRAHQQPAEEPIAFLSNLNQDGRHPEVRPVGAPESAEGVATP